ncbi:MAG: glycoside hydrolase family 16 protein [Spirochaetes bacterium]|nr:glycoside hydrolase family 16 protein [Spirochaetota bacterium]
MKKKAIIIILTGLLATCSDSSQKNGVQTGDNPLIIPDTAGEEYQPGAEYKLIWSDEFDGTEIDTSVWSYETTATGWSQSWNQEWQLYTNNGTGGKNAYIKDGVLVIQANMTSSTHQQSAYTSARMVTANNRSFKYVKVAARMALPYGSGIWPAFWMLGESRQWPASGEIDVMEMIGGSGHDNQVHATLHWDDGGHKYKGSKTEIENPAQFHIYELEWDSEKIRIGVDGNFYFSMDITDDSLSEFHQPFYLLLNLAVGGEWGGYPDNSTIFPQYFMIDWIRVYEK